MRNYIFKTSILLYLIFCLCQGLLGQSAATKSQIKQIFEVQTEAWNKGDIQAFMQTYWKSDELLFLGKAGPVYGWQNTLERYLRTYPDRQTMGQLEFDIMDIKGRSDDVCSVVGKYHLTREGMDDLEGHFLIIVKHIGARWIIVADSTH